MVLVSTTTKECHFGIIWTSEGPLIVDYKALYMVATNPQAILASQLRKDIGPWQIRFARALIVMRVGGAGQAPSKPAMDLTPSR